MEILKAKQEHIDLIFDLLKAVATDMRAQGVFQWNENYPTRSHVERDVADGIVYIGYDKGAIAGVISIDDNQSPEYLDIPWKYRNGTIMVVHRLAVFPGTQKKGIGRALMDFALDQAIQNGYSAIRLDAYSKNERTLRFYENRGYQKRGKIFFPYRKEPFYCYEKSLK